jgi:hypothetical protein
MKQFNWSILLESRIRAWPRLLRCEGTRIGKSACWTGRAKLRCAAVVRR